MSEMSEPLIVCAAMRYKGEQECIIASPRHFDKTVHNVLGELADVWMRCKHSDWEQGFIDQHGNFYTREEAFVIATKNNQIRRPSTYETNLLYSENLY